MSKRRLTTILVTLAALGALSGCGGSGGDASSVADLTDPVPLKLTFIKQGDAICAQGRKEVETKFAAFLKKEGIKGIGPGGGETPAETKARETEVIETIGIPALRKQLDELRALGAPKGEEAEVKAYLDAAEEAIEKGEENPPLLFSAARKTFAEADKLAQELGFSVCGSR